MSVSQVLDPPMPPRSTASKSRSSTRRRRSRCAAACRTAWRMYTGDDFNYPELIAGDAEGYSDALLGIFDAIAPAASAALAALGGQPARGLQRHPGADGRRCRATSSRRRPGSTRPASSSWPISTATRTISSWSAVRRARARSATWPSCSARPTRPACCPIRTCAAAAPCRVRSTASECTRHARSDAGASTGLSINQITTATSGRCARRSRAMPATACAASRVWRDKLENAASPRTRKMLLPITA